MMKYARAIVFSLVVVSAAVAQTPEGFVPVDQAVGDLDRLSTSSRQVNPGLRLDGEHTSLFRIDAEADRERFGFSPSTATGQPLYYRVAPGLQALADRIDYAVPAGRNSFNINVAPPRDGLFLELIHANTVFVLTPPSPPPVTPMIDHRIDGRIDGRVNLQINGSVQEPEYPNSSRHSNMLYR